MCVGRLRCFGKRYKGTVSLRVGMYLLSVIATLRSLLVSKGTDFVSRRRTMKLAFRVFSLERFMPSVVVCVTWN